MQRQFFTAAHHLPRLLHFRQLRHKQSRGPSCFSSSGFGSLLLNTLCTENSSRAVAAAAVDSAQHLPRLDGCAQTNHARPHVSRQAAFVHCCYRLCTPKTTFALLHERVWALEVAMGRKIYRRGQATASPDASALACGVGITY